MSKDRGTSPHGIHAPSGRLATWEQRVIEESVDGVFCVDRDGRVISMNRAARRIFRCQDPGACGTTLDDFIPERFRRDHVAHVEGFFARSRPRDMSERMPVRALRADGEEFYADVGLIPIPTEFGFGAACIVRDITERMEAEAAALQADKLESLRLLSAGLAHDFNNILTAVIGNADFALREVGPDSPAFLALHDICESGRRAAELVEQMLRFAGRTETATGDIEINTVVQEMSRLLRGALKPGVRSVLDLSTPGPVVSGDVVGVRQVIMNLVINASEAIGEGRGEICVATGTMTVDGRFLRHCAGAASAAGPGEYAYLEVRDDGTGMSTEIRSRIFDPYFSTKFSGHGLGLASILGIVRAHRGAIHVSSRPGKGTRFRVLLPLAGSLLPE